MATLDRTEKTAGDKSLIAKIAGWLTKSVPKFKLHSTVVTRRYERINLPAGLRVSIVEGPWKLEDGSFSYGIEVPRPLPHGFSGDSYVEVVPEEFLEAS